VVVSNTNNLPLQLSALAL